MTRSLVENGSAVTVRPALLAVLIGVVALPAAGQGTGTAQPVSATMIASVVDSATYRLTVVLRVMPGWHIYGREPGDAGLPTRIDWSLPGDDEIVGVDWPAAVRATRGSVTTYEYEGEVRIVATAMRTTGRGAGKPVSAEVTWAACSDVCIVGGVRLEADRPAIASSDGGGSIPLNSGIGYIAGVGRGDDDVRHVMVHASDRN